MKFQFVFGCLTVLTLTSCLKTKTESQTKFHMNEIEKLEVHQACTAMKTEGNILNLLSKIKQDTDQILNLLKQENVTKEEKQISLLAKRISFNAKKVRSLSQDDWTDSKYDHEIQWDITYDDFHDLLSFYTGTFEILDFDIRGIYLLGEERQDLKDSTRVVYDNDGIHLTYKNKASSLELCQLEETLMIVVEVKYNALVNEKTRYFNLIVRK